MYRGPDASAASGVPSRGVSQAWIVRVASRGTPATSGAEPEGVDQTALEGHFRGISGPGGLAPIKAYGSAPMLRLRCQ